MLRRRQVPALALWHSVWLAVSTTTGAAAASANRGASVGWERSVPQSPQKLASGEFSEPHFGQRTPNATPHRMQNFLPAAFSKSQH